jgi:DNA-directed RNA polymerase subunit M/transcription elongation factor TFIIS
MKIKVKNTFPEYRLNLIKNFDDLEYIPHEQIIEFETALYQYTIEFSNKNNIRISSREFIKIYTDKYVHIILNVDISSYVKNEFIYNKLIKNEIKLIDLLHMQPRNMCPEKWAFYKDIEEININAINQGSSMLCRTNLFVCSRCKNNNTEYQEKQTRSADEPSTFYISCLNCGKKWTQ